MPRGRPGPAARATSRMRRRRALRVTALPHFLLIAYPTWGYTPGTAASTATKVTRTGPLLARALERCACANAARVWILPTVRAGTSSSDGETVAPLEPP